MKVKLFFVKEGKHLVRVFDDVTDISYQSAMLLVISDRTRSYVYDSEMVESMFIDYD